jgi:ABC-2 type transport system ATP-binding protein
MDEAQELADEVAIVSGGRIVAQGSPESLGGRDVAATTITFRMPAGSALPPALEAEGATGQDGAWSIQTRDPVRVLHRLTGWSLDEDIPLESLRVSRPSLEDVYLEITGGVAGTE